MTEFFEFLNQQSGLRLFGYGFVLIVVLTILSNFIVGIFRAIFSSNKSDKSSIDKGIKDIEDQIRRSKYGK